MRLADICQDAVTASYTVAGMVRARRKSERARLKMKTFRAVLISLVKTAVSITSKFPRTDRNIFTGNKILIPTSTQDNHGVDGDDNTEKRFTENDKR